MLPRKIIFLFLILLLIFSACQPSQAEPIPALVPQIIKIGLPPALAYLKVPVSVCADQDISYDILLLEKNSYDWQAEPVDIVFTIQNAVDGIPNTYLIDHLEIVIIASSDFPSFQLHQDQLRAIFNTEMVSPSQIGLTKDTLISIWGFESGSDMAALFEHQYGFSPQLPVDAYLAAGPESMVEKMADQSMAIGYTLSAVVTDQVKVLPLSLDEENSPVPVIASFLSSPSDTGQSFIRCLQSSLIN